MKFQVGMYSTFASSGFLQLSAENTLELPDEGIEDLTTASEHVCPLPLIFHQRGAISTTCHESSTRPGRKIKALKGASLVSYVPQALRITLLDPHRSLHILCRFLHLSRPHQERLDRHSRKYPHKFYSPLGGHIP